MGPVSGPLDEAALHISLVSAWWIDPVYGHLDEATLHISLVSAWWMGPVSGPLDEAESWVLCAADELTVLNPQQWRGHYPANIL